jgi:pantoate--beta-alanine ligase
VAGSAAGSLDTVVRIHSVRERVAQWRRHGHTVAFVPTNGTLHKGHVSLVEAALARADRVVASVYVNPLQFGSNEEYDRQPRTLEHDTELLTKAGVHLLFAPTTFELYPAGYERSTIVDVPELSGILDGPFRPGYLAGVATVTTKLLQIVQPDCAVLGEKDWQRLVIVRRLVADLCIPMEVVGVPVVRDHDGLAIGSSNRGLSRSERNGAPRLYAALKNARQRILDGERDYAALQSAGRLELERGGFQPDYFSVRQASDLLPPRADSRELVVLAAARLGDARLLDSVRISLAK